MSANTHTLFDTWMKQVDKELNTYVGLTHLDLGDAPYYDYYSDGMSAKEAAGYALVEWNDLSMDLVEEFGIEL